MDRIHQDNSDQSFIKRIGRVVYSEFIPSLKIGSYASPFHYIFAYKSNIPSNNHNKIDFNNEFGSSSLGESMLEFDPNKLINGNADVLMTNKLFPCPAKNCSKVYTSSYGLKYHMDHGHTVAKMTEKRPYICNVKNCGKTYKNNNGLKYHIMHSHQGIEYDEIQCRYK